MGTRLFPAPLLDELGLFLYVSHSWALLMTLPLLLSMFFDFFFKHGIFTKLFHRKQWKIFIEDLEHTQGRYSPPNTIYSIPKGQPGFEHWTTLLRDTSHYHLCQSLLVDSWHFCVDHRAPNSITIPNKFLIAVIKELVYFKFLCSPCRKRWLTFVADRERIQDGYSPPNTIYSIPKGQSGFEHWTILLRDTNRYHLCQPFLVDSWHFCADHKAPNSITISNKFPIVVIKELVYFKFLCSLLTPW